MIKKSRIENIPLSEVYSNPENYKKNTQKAIEAVAKSIKSLGYLKTSITIDETNTILTGHTTYHALKQLEYETIPEIDKIKGLTDNQKRAYRIADNHIASYDEIDYDKLDKELRLLGAELLDITGYEIDTTAIEQDLDQYTQSIKNTEKVKKADESEALDLEDIPTNLKNTQEDTKPTPKIYHCPKCGFEFGVD